MRLVLLNAVKLLFLALTFRIAATLMEPSSDSPQTAATVSVELRRGFNAATYATRDVHHPETWLENLQKALAVANEHNTNNSAFFIGTQFGLSYWAVELSRNDRSPDRREMRELLIQGTLARLKYEQGKHVLGISDADIVRCLRIPIASFAMWKGSCETTDVDRTVIDPTNWLLL